MILFYISFNYSYPSSNDKSILAKRIVELYPILGYITEDDSAVSEVYTNNNLILILIILKLPACLSLLIKKPFARISFKLILFITIF